MFQPPQMTDSFNILFLISRQRVVFVLLLEMVTVTLVKTKSLEWFVSDAG